jgi:hypothetical protein
MTFRYRVTLSINDKPLVGAEVCIPHFGSIVAPIYSVGHELENDIQTDRAAYERRESYLNDGVVKMLTRADDVLRLDVRDIFRLPRNCSARDFRLTACPECLLSAHHVDIAGRLAGLLLRQ